MHQKVSESTILLIMSVLIEWSSTDVTQYGCDLVICHEYDKYQASQPLSVTHLMGAEFVYSQRITFLSSH